MIDIDKQELKRAFSVGAGIVFGTLCAFKFLVDKGIIRETVEKLNKQIGSIKNREIEDKTKQ